ncbi:UL43 [Gallid alphaherpesvirus 2]|uniref:UL43 n=1 Tax=Gallid alphaherpesvirus 2 TaxID=10390 RepID=Q9IBT0_9ALPH|nr:UL43 [Gallid alphaherpesvirus 2]
MDSVNNSSLPPSYTTTGRTYGHCLQMLTCLEPPCTTTNGNGISNNRCLKCIVVTMCSIFSIAAHLAITLSCITLIQFIDQKIIYINCTIYAITGFLIAFIVRLTIKSSEVLTSIGKPAQFIFALISSIADTLITRNMLIDSNPSYVKILRAIEMTSLMCFVMLGAFIASYHYVCLATSGDLTWKAGFLILTAGTIIGISAPYGNISSLFGFLFLYTILAINVVRDASKALMNTCYYRICRATTLRHPSRLGCGRMSSTQDVNATHEEAISSADTIDGQIPMVVMSHATGVLIPVVIALQRYMTKETVSLTSTDMLQGVCGVLVGASVSIFIPSRRDESLSRPIIILLSIIGAMAITLAGFGLVLGPTLFSACAAALACYTCINIRNANKGIKQLAAAYVVKSILGFIITSLLVCILVALS